MFAYLGANFPVKTLIVLDDSFIGMSSDYVSQLFCRDILLQLLRSLVESLYILEPTSCSHLHYVRVS